MGLAGSVATGTTMSLMFIVKCGRQSYLLMVSSKSAFTTLLIISFVLQAMQCETAFTASRVLKVNIKWLSVCVVAVTYFDPNPVIKAQF